MPLFSDTERGAAGALARLTYANPFLPERLDLERQALGADFVQFDIVWHPHADLLENNPNVARSTALAERLALASGERLRGGVRAAPAERALHRDLVLYALYYRFQKRLAAVILSGADAPVEFWPEFRDQLAGALGEREDAPHLFAAFFQIRRAFHYTFGRIVGGSLPVARLRAAVWESIFTHDLRRYMAGLHRHMGQISTLIAGPSGTGKELVARAIGLARYIPFDPPSRRFRESFEESFFPLNLSALTPTLIESELFGHRRGAFTGAVDNRKGWLEVCPPLGTVFLDEIGEVELAIQVKLLRLLETRVFSRLGESTERTFAGKLLAATNRDLAQAMHDRRFRDDLYFRLCADTITTPTLAARLADRPEELEDLLLVLAQRLVGEELATPLAREARVWIEHHLGREYAWPGNVRELRQCLTNVLVRGRYTPPDRAAAGVRERLSGAMLETELSAEDLLRSYVTLAYARTPNYVSVGERLGLDRRTVRRYVDARLLEELRDSPT